MQITIDTAKLPEGTTEEQVLATIHEGLAQLLDRAQDEEPLAEALYEQFPNPRERPKVEDPAKLALSMLNSGDLSYLRETNKGYGHNDYMKGWSATYTIRKKLKRLGLVNVKHTPAGKHINAVPITYCTPTPLGSKVLRKANR